MIETAIVFLTGSQDPAHHDSATGRGCSVHVLILTGVAAHRVFDADKPTRGVVPGSANTVQWIADGMEDTHLHPAVVFDRGGASRGPAGRLKRNRGSTYGPSAAAGVLIS